jgi:hypothetical protein
MLFKLFVFLFFAKTKLCTCHFEKKHLKMPKQKLVKIKQAKLPTQIKESSGLVFLNEKFISHGDSDCPATLYVFDKQSSLLDSIKLNSKIKNIDWEDLSVDDQKQLFIADIGDNLSVRSEYQIIKIKKDNSIEELSFYYPEKKLSNKTRFDAEAIFWYQSSLFIVTKSWEKRKKTSYLYKIKDRGEGLQAAVLIDSIQTKAFITGAALSPDQSEFSLITYGKMYRFKIAAAGPSFREPISCSPIRAGQTEGLSYNTTEKWAVSNERGQFFLFKLDK